MIPPTLTFTYTDPQGKITFFDSYRRGPLPGLMVVAGRSPMNLQIDRRICAIVAAPSGQPFTEEWKRGFWGAWAVQDFGPLAALLGHDSATLLTYLHPFGITPVLA